VPRKTRSVLVVDDSELARTLVVHLLRRDPKFRVRATAHDGLQAIDLADEECPDLIVLDQDMPGPKGLEVIPRLRALCPAARIVLWSTDPSLEPLVAAVGGDGFISKSEPVEKLMDWLHAA
jgi:two-component system nitrate/nitrite response regulator NarL